MTRRLQRQEGAWSLTQDKFLEGGTASLRQTNKTVNWPHWQRVRIDYCLTRAEEAGAAEGLIGVSGGGCMAAGAEGGVAKGDFCKSQLGEMQTTLGQIRVMLRRGRRAWEQPAWHFRKSLEHISPNPELLATVVTA